MSLVA